MTYRYRQISEVIYGQMRDVIDLTEEMTAVCASRGWVKPTYWGRTVGAANTIAEEREYSSLDAFQKETRAMQTDPEYMKLVRAAAAHVVQGKTYDELWETTSHIA